MHVSMLVHGAWGCMCALAGMHAHKHARPCASCAPTCVRSMPRVSAAHVCAHLVLFLQSDWLFTAPSCLWQSVAAGGRGCRMRRQGAAPGQRAPPHLPCMHMCAQACACPCVHVHMHACVLACMCACTHARVHVRLHACVHACVHTDMCACMHATAYTGAHARLRPRMRARACMRPSVRPSIRPCAVTWPAQATQLSHDGIAEGWC